MLVTRYQCDNCKTETEDRDAHAGWVRTHIKRLSIALLPRQGNTKRVSEVINNNTENRCFDFCCVQCFQDYIHTLLFLEFSEEEFEIKPAKEYVKTDAEKRKEIQDWVNRGIEPAVNICSKCSGGPDKKHQDGDSYYYECSGCGKSTNSYRSVVDAVMEWDSINKRKLVLVLTCSDCGVTPNYFEDSKVCSGLEQISHWYACGCGKESAMCDTKEEAAEKWDEMNERDYSDMVTGDSEKI